MTCIPTPKASHLPLWRCLSRQTANAKTLIAPKSTGQQRWPPWNLPFVKVKRKTINLSLGLEPLDASVTSVWYPAFLYLCLKTRKESSRLSLGVSSDFYITIRVIFWNFWSCQNHRFMMKSMRLMTKTNFIINWTKNIVWLANIKNASFNYDNY